MRRGIFATVLGAVLQAAAFAQGSVVDTRPVPAVHSPSPLAPGWQHGAFIEIFVRAYRDSDGDGIGDLRGLISKLDYLRDLGIKGIWLMPVSPSADRDHGYATTDYRDIEPAYGTLADFDELLKQAHARGIGVIIDYVVNHSAASHPLFIASKRADSPYRDWYLWRANAPAGWDIWGKNPWTQTPDGAFFGTFGPHMPDFNLRHPQAIEYHMSSLRFWLNRGLDGFRLDAVPHLVENNERDWNDQPESRRLTAEMRALIGAYPRRHVVCEATANPKIYAQSDVCGSAFAFGLEHQIVRAAKGDSQAPQAIVDYFKSAPPTMATMVSNHDIFAGERLWDQVGGKLAQYKLAAASYLLAPGTPFIYYGEEIGMAGVKGLPGDQPLRTPMSWAADSERAGFTSGRPFRPISPNVATHNAAAQAADPNSLLSFYKAMLALRNRLPSIAQGSYESPFVQGPVMGYRRVWGDEQTLVLINYGERRADVDVPGVARDERWVQEYPASAEPASAVRVEMAPQSVRVLRRRP